MNIPPVPPLPEQSTPEQFTPDTMPTVVYNDLLKHYSGLAMQNLLGDGKRKLSPATLSELTLEAFDIAVSMIREYDLYRRWSK